MNYQNMLDAAEKQQKVVEEVTDSTNFLPQAFLKTGKHVGRFIADPTEIIYFPIVAHQVGKLWLKCMSTENEKDLLCKWAEESETRWKVRKRVCCKTYFHLLETSIRDDQYWRPGTTYLLIGGARYAKALGDTIIPLLRSDLATWGKLFNPEVPADGTFTINHDASATSIGYNPTVKAPVVQVGSWREPLKTIWLNADYNPTTEDFEKALTAAMSVEGTVLNNEMKQTSPAEINNQGATPLGNTQSPVQQPAQTQQPIQQQTATTDQTPAQSNENLQGVFEVDFTGPNGQHHKLLLPSEETLQIEVAKSQISCWTQFSMQHSECVANKCGVNALCVRQRGGIQ